MDNIVYSSCFSPDGGILAGGGQDPNVFLWDVDTGQCLKTLTGHTMLIYSVRFSQRDDLLANGSEDKTICLWDTSNIDAANGSNCVHVLRAILGLFDLSALAQLRMSWPAAVMIKPYVCGMYMRGSAQYLARPYERDKVHLVHG
ncbi:MAG: hypothetical protein AAF702_37450 [Chloroflexota bacterium]